MDGRIQDEGAASGRFDVRRVDITDAEAVEAALPGAALLWLESPTNPALEVADRAADAGNEKIAVKSLETYVQLLTPRSRLSTVTPTARACL